MYFYFHFIQYIIYNMDKLPNANTNETANSSHIITADKSWSVTNTNTLLKWITIGSHYIKVLEQNIADNRMIIRCNTIQSIALTTATGSIGVSQISSMFSAQTQLALTMIFTIMSFFLTLSTGVIKVMLIHENLEKCIQVKQEWTSFITNISTELQLPRSERQDAVKLIRDNKMMYLSLLNKDVEIYTSSSHAKKYIIDEIHMSKMELDFETTNKNKYKDGKNDFLIDLELLRKSAVHNDYSKMMNSVGISISDITNHIVKTELQSIVEFDLEAQYKQVKKKELEIAKNKFTNELQNRVKDIETKRHTNMLTIIERPESESEGDWGRGNSVGGSRGSPHRKDMHNDNKSDEEGNTGEGNTGEGKMEEDLENRDVSSGFFRNLFRT